jgi:hypothetical protein
MLKFFRQETDYMHSKVGVLVICPYLKEGWSTMSMLHDGMEFMTKHEEKPPEQTPVKVVPDLLRVEECLLVAHRLLGVVQDETKALKEFDTDHLLQLVTQKEALVRDLGCKLNALKHFGNGVQDHTDRLQGVSLSGDSAVNPSSSEVVHKRLVLRDVLMEIERGNAINRIFIEGSLSFGNEILELFVPGTYAVGQEGQAERLTPSTKGLALDKEV